MTNLVVSFIDGLITVDGETHTCDLARPPDHANYGPAYFLKWFGQHGYIKYERGPGISITDPAQFGDYVDVWMNTRSQALDAAAAEHDRALAATKAHREEEAAGLAGLRAIPHSARNKATNRIIEHMTDRVNKLKDMEAEFDRKSKHTKARAKQAKAEHAQRKADKTTPKLPKPHGGDHG